MSSKPKMSLDEALGVLAAPRNIQLAFKQAFHAKSYPIKSIETQVLTGLITTLAHWAISEQTQVKVAVAERDTVIAELKKWVQLREGAEKEIAEANSLIKQENITNADAAKIREKYYSAGYADAIAYHYQHTSFELQKVAAEAQGKLQAFHVISEAIDELSNPDNINLDYYEIDKDGNLQLKKLPVYCPHCGEKLVFPKGHITDQSFKCKGCSNIVNLASIRFDFPTHKVTTSKDQIK